MQSYESVEAEIRKLIEELNPEIFVVDIALKTGKTNVLSILLETDDGISIDAITKVSRKLGHYFEEEDPFPWPFRLEVSSPGVGRPLMVRRQYHMNIGRKLKVVGLDGMITKGKLASVDEDGFTLEPAPSKNKKKAPGKRSGEVKTDTYIKFDSIKEAKVEISFD